MTTPSPKPSGRSLNDFGELLPAERQLRDAARQGEATVIDSERPTERSPDNEIRAAFLRFLALGGDENTPVHEQGVKVIGAWISGIFDVTACDIPGNFVVVNSHFAAPPVLQDAHFHGVLNLSGSQLPGLTADRLLADGSVFLRKGFSSTGEVRLLRAHIGGTLDCGNGRFNNPNADALNADGANIQGDVFLNDNFQAQGEVRLLGAHIGGDLACRKGSFNNPSGNALHTDNANIAGDVFLNDNFQAQGEVRLLGAHIGGNLECHKGRFNNPNGDALSADRAKIAENIYFDEGFQAQGAVRLAGAQIVGDLYCDGGSFSNEKGNAFVAEKMSVTGSFAFHTLREPVTGINLTGAEVGALVDDQQSWGSGLALDGFVYHRLSGNAPCDAAKRIAWLNKQQNDHCNSPDNFKPQPWKQLIRTLRKTGHDEAARQVAIAYETHRRKNKIIRSPISRAFHWLFGLFIAYGYRPQRLFFIMLGVWLCCAGIYWTAALHEVFAPSNPLVFNHREYAPCRPGYLPGPMQPDVPHTYGNWYLCPELAGEYTGFSPLAYSLDLILPLVDLQQEHDWAPYIPTPEAKVWDELTAGSKYHLTRLLVWFEILFGWVTSLLLVAVVSGLTNRDKEE